VASPSILYRPTANIVKKEALPASGGLKSYKESFTEASNLFLRLVILKLQRKYETALQNPQRE
jgi:hypothetical protein